MASPNGLDWVSIAQETGQTEGLLDHECDIQQGDVWRGRCKGELGEDKGGDGEAFRLEGSAHRAQVGRIVLD
jgi:hypothetical protein